jgi:hypothetical protein
MKKARVGPRLLCVLGTLVLVAAMEDGASITAFAASPAPKLTVSPSTNLIDGQGVQVQGSGFAGQSNVALFECKSGAATEADCDTLAVASLVTSLTGSFTNGANVARIITVGGVSVDCAAPDSCVMGAALVPIFPAVTNGSLNSPGTTNGAFDLIATAPISFNGSVPPLTYDFSSPVVSPIAPDGSVTADGTVACNRPVALRLYALLAEPGTQGSQEGEVSVVCDPSGAPWSAVLRAGLPYFPGTASLLVTASAFNSRPVAQRSETVNLISGSGSTPRYYVVLGDSLATGGAAPPGQGYQDDLFAHYERTIPGLRLIDLGCGGETSTSFIKGSFCGGSQLENAEEFLTSHAGQIAFVTIDIGGNDIVGCGTPSTPSSTARQCVAAVLSTIKTNLTHILQGLRSAGGANLPIYAMNYFNPLVVYWLDGPSGETFAENTDPFLKELNDELTSIYVSFKVPVADVASAFSASDFTQLVPTQWGKVPLSVDRACSWLDARCVVGSAELGDDSNAAGNQVIATSFEKVMTPVVSVPPPASIRPPSNTAPSTSPPSSTTGTQTAGTLETEASGSTLAATGIDALKMALLGFAILIVGLLLVGVEIVGSRPNNAERTVASIDVSDREVRREEHSGHPNYWRI